MKQERNNIATNPKAYHDYFIDDKIECGIELVGTEVKSVRARKSKYERQLCRYQKWRIVYL